MPITPGSSSKLNSLYGLSSVMVTTASEEVTLANKVLPAGLLLKKSDGKIYLTDGVSTLANIPVLVDNVLTTVEKSFLANAVSNGAYARAAGGVVVHGSGGKISDDSLNLVSNNKIVESYLSDYIDPTTHKVLLSALPDTVRAGVTYVADITARNALTAEQKKSLAFVIDASDDSTVTSGAAMYGWDATANNNEGEWIKIAEVESMDLDINAMRCDYNNVQNMGAVMYDHMVHLTPSTATEFVTLSEVSDEPTVVDTIHNETRDYSELGWEDFITGLGDMYSGPSGDVYLRGDEDFAVIESDTLDLINTTLTITCSSTNTTITLPVTALVENNSDKAVIAYSRDDAGLTAISTYSNSQESDQVVNMSVTDGTHTYSRTATRSSFYDGHIPSLDITDSYYWH